MKTRNARSAPVIAVSLSAVLTACTGVDGTIGMGQNGPVPSIDIGSTSMLGAPVGSMSAAAGDSIGAPQTQYPVAAYPAATSPSAAYPPAASEPLTPRRAAVASEPLAPPPATLASQPLAPLPTQVAATPPPAAISASATAAVRTAGEIQFLPLVGAPQDKAELLARALSDTAAAQNLRIRPASESVADVRLKGYFSAFNDGSKTTLVYVWDVLDANDQRIKRIQGQEAIPGKTDDPWAAVDLTTFQAVARRTLSEAAELPPRAG